MQFAARIRVTYDARYTGKLRAGLAESPAPVLDAFEAFCHDAGAGLGDGAIPMRSDTPRRPIALAVFIGGPALFIAGFFVAAHNYAIAAVLAVGNHPRLRGGWLVCQEAVAGLMHFGRLALVCGLCDKAVGGG